MSRGLACLGFAIVALDAGRCCVGDESGSQDVPCGVWEMHRLDADVLVTVHSGDLGRHFDLNCQFSLGGTMRGLILGAVLAFAINGAALAHDGGHGGEYSEGGYFEGDSHGREFEHSQGEHPSHHLRDEDSARDHPCRSPDGAWTCGH